MTFWIRIAKNYGLNGSPTQVERIFPPKANEANEKWSGDVNEITKVPMKN